MVRHTQHSVGNNLAEQCRPTVMLFHVHAATSLFVHPTCLAAMVAWEVVGKAGVVKGLVKVEGGGKGRAGVGVVGMQVEVASCKCRMSACSWREVQHRCQACHVAVPRWPAAPALKQECRYVHMCSGTYTVGALQPQVGSNGRRTEFVL
jgi:hypothetical protein